MSCAIELKASLKKGKIRGANIREFLPTPTRQMPTYQNPVYFFITFP
jgi:hypothetical protein